MNSNFDPRNKSMQPSPDSFSQLDALQRDRFELLSAYLDGEVTATERKQVEEWLATDASMQTLHNRLMKLRQGFRALPAPAPSQPVDQAVEQVFAKVDRRPNLRLVWGGSAIAAMFVGAVTVLSLSRSTPPQVAVDPTTPKPEMKAEQPLETDGLMIALDRPVVTMAKNAPANQKSPQQTHRNAQ
jgi:anti-sigma factor RsiW